MVDSPEPVILWVNNAVSIEDNNPRLRGWRANSNGSIPCPPNAFGGCGSSLLELKCLFEEKFIAELLEKSNSVINNGTKLELDSSKCSCFTESSDMNDITSRKSSCRQNSCDNYIYCPTARDVQNGSLDHFQEHWLKGQPVIVRDSLALTPGLSWEPMADLKSWLVRLLFSVGTVFFSHNNSTGTVFFSQIQPSERGLCGKNKDERLSFIALECLTWREVCDILNNCFLLTFKHCSKLELVPRNGDYHMHKVTYKIIDC